jgi:hypothetical protein
VTAGPLPVGGSCGRGVVVDGPLRLELVDDVHGVDDEDPQSTQRSTQRSTHRSPHNFFQKCLAFQRSTRRSTRHPHGPRTGPRIGPRTTFFRNVSRSNGPRDGPRATRTVHAPVYASRFVGGICVDCTAERDCLAGQNRSTRPLQDTRPRLNEICGSA